MKGLELSRRYFEAFGPSLFAGLPADVRAQAAVGLVGPGSECLGFDDELSRDHDFGPGFCIWLPAAVFDVWGPELQRRYDALPRTFLGFTRPQAAPLSGKRVGVFETGSFLRAFTGLDRPPATSREWLAIPEQFLAVVSGGEVFVDEGGGISAARRVYEGFYPEPVVRQKVAANLATMAQAGQYNLPRCLSRGDAVAAGAARAEFACALMAVLHLLSRVYMPFYKWSFRSLVERTAAGRVYAGRIEALVAAPVRTVRAGEIECLCAGVLGAVRALGWTGCASDFLLDAALDIHGRIEDEYLRACPLGAGAYA